MRPHIIEAHRQKNWDDRHVFSADLTALTHLGEVKRKTDLSRCIRLLLYTVVQYMGGCNSFIVLVYSFYVHYVKDITY